jgi:hypothetical protein
MVNIFGIKLFEGSSMDEQMHYKSRKGTKRRGHGPNCQCPLCIKKKHRHGQNCLDCTKNHKHGPNCYNCSKSRYRHSRKRYKGGYVYNKKGANNEEEDVTMSLASKSKSKSKSKTRSNSRSNSNSNSN